MAGRIVAVGAGVAEARLGERVLVDPWLRDPEHPGDRANLCMTDGGVESVREIDPEDWSIR